ncbi:MAG: sugar MFS transporter [Bacteroidetes bacterium]|jgi:MFS transporter, FHS family, L-fucose permease|nr:sugar MFS transporter [Bacteroidota bacterium]MBT3801763.1 sugar MFS transporter [Bacteroidota bacterium]MBT4728941.1 sugar MFS transporter [Bacteroidota bacterium]MBT5991119.1 sugar MFS transporter [Bacteroidota bacterium]MBT7995521.1 sugar MFS transporter [Bacteroidota bacterium]
MTVDTRKYTGVLISVTFLFLIWGFLTVMNDILIPYFKDVFELSHFKSMLVQFAFFIAYFIGSLVYLLISISSGDPITKIGYKKAIIIGLLISAFGAFLFYPAAHYQSYAFFLLALFILALGFTMLQIAANPYVAILGPEKTASSRLNLAQGFNSLGTTLAPAIGGFMIFKFFGEQSTGADAVRVPYLIFGAVLLLLALFIRFAKLPQFVNKGMIEKGAGALKYPHLVLGMIAVFMYVGGEVSIGSIMIKYLGLNKIAGLSEIEASKIVSLYWGGLMIGRFLGAISLSDFKNLLVKRIIMLGIPVLAFVIITYLFDFSIAWKYLVLMAVQLIGFTIGKSMPARTLTIFGIAVTLLLIVGVSTNGQIAMWAIVGIGLFNSIMWSNIFTLAIKGLGKHTSQGSSLLVMMILGGALVPMLLGAVADEVGVHYALVVPVVCYLYIIFYGIRGHKIKVVAK